MGVVQVIPGVDHDIQLNPKKSPIHCQFCDNNHHVSSYPQRETLKMFSNEYLLSLNSPNVNESLKSWIKFSIPYLVEAVRKPLYSIVMKDMLKANFIIHEAVQLPGLALNEVESLNLKVSFLGDDTLPVPMYNDLWISGGVMNTLIPLK